ncbi:hypothetical protein TcCL_Unassigned02261 [Trypanosoma cruzi]|nr:hypothetical protein TcCL_Unassigned02261 [Trypanosoma cruzi]
MEEITTHTGTSHTRTHSLSPFTPPLTRVKTWVGKSRRTTHARGRTQRHRQPRRTATKGHGHSTPTAATRGTGRIQVHAAVLYFSLPRRIGITPHSGSWRVASHTHSEARRTPSAPLRLHSAGRRPVTLVAPQWGTQTIVVADHRCL